jgi:hypothetical protein
MQQFDVQRHDVSPEFGDDVTIVNEVSTSGSLS